MKNFILAAVAVVLLSGGANAGYAVVVNEAFQADGIEYPWATDIFSGVTRDWTNIPCSGLSGTILPVALAPTTEPSQSFLYDVLLTAFSPEVNIIRGANAPLIASILAASNANAIVINDASQPLRPHSKTIVLY